MFLEYQVALQSFATEMVHRYREAREDHERGQTFVEWLGVMAIIVLVVTALVGLAPGIGNKISGLVTDAIDKLGELAGLS
jgi:hypothetical protein